MQRPIKNEDSSNNSDESSIPKKTKPLQGGNYRHVLTQKIHTGICKCLSIRLEEKELWIKQFQEYKSSLEVAIHDERHAHLLTFPSTNGVSLLMDVLRLPFARNDDTPLEQFSRYCQTRAQAFDRCEKLLNLMLTTTRQKPAVFKKLIFFDAMGKTTLHSAIKTKSAEIVHTYLEHLTVAIQIGILSSIDVLKDLIQKCDKHGKNIFQVATELNDLEIINELMRFIQNNYPEAHAGNIILAKLFSVVTSSSQEVENIKQMCISETASAKIAAAQAELAALGQNLEAERRQNAILSGHNAALYRDVQAFVQQNNELMSRLQFENSKLVEEKDRADLMRHEIAVLRQELAQAHSELGKERYRLQEERRLRENADEKIRIAATNYTNITEDLAHEVRAREEGEHRLAVSQSELRQSHRLLQEQDQRIAAFLGEANELRERLRRAETALTERREDEARRDRYGERLQHYGRIHTPPREGQDPRDASPNSSYRRRW